MTLHERIQKTAFRLYLCTEIVVFNRIVAQDHRFAFLALSLFLVGSVALRSQGQLVSDQVPHQRILPASEELRQQLDRSRFRLGVFRLQPSFAIRDFGYDNNVYGTPTDPVSDWRATVAAGFRTVVPFGSKLYFRGDVLPEYTHYVKLVNRRAFGGAYGASVLGLYNRMSARAGANIVRAIAPVNSENERSALGTLRGANAGMELYILRRLAIFGEALGQQQRYAVTQDDLQRGLLLQSLERDERLLRSGVRYRFSSSLDFSAAAETTRTSFVTGSARDNRSSALVLGVLYDRQRSFLNISIGTRRGEALVPSDSFPRYSTVTGSYFASRELSSRILLQAYGNRGVDYSRSSETPYYFETRNGLDVVIPLGHRFAVRTFGEVGENNYARSALLPIRTDKVNAYGVGVGARLYRDVSLVTLASQKRIVSNTADDRTVFRVSTALVFTGGGLFR